MDKLFVYGIFLDESMRDEYGMTHPCYDVAPDYLTRRCGSSIVEAVYVPGLGLGLTGLVVHISPLKWPDLDRLESGYNRTTVHTEGGEDAYIYVSK